MVISSSVLFHFTNNAENLINILSHEFRPKYCLENLANLFVNSGELQQAAPITCFCDLPLSQLSEHLNFYGNYGIGMKKEWGILQGINPVLYLQAESSLANSICFLMKNILNAEKKEPYAFASVMELINYVKLYEGDSIRNGKRIHKKFYDEREWRWVPYRIKEEKLYKNLLSADEFNNPVIRAEANEIMFNYEKLSFEPDDIKYIIVSKENEILPMIKSIERIKEKYSTETVKVLTSKIISAEQIKTDF